MSKITEEQARTYEIVVNLTLKIVLCIACIYFLNKVITAMLSENVPENKLAYGIISTALTGAIFLPFRHYFPSIGKRNSTKPRK